MAGFWAEVERRRKRAKLSRAELARRAGISESTIFVGLSRASRPARHTRQVVELVLAMAERLRSDGARP